MKFKFISMISLLLLGVLLFSSCGKENIDVSTTEEDEVEPEEILCDLEVILAEQPPGSGMIFTAVTGGTAPFTYSWSSGATTANITVNAIGTFSVTVTDAVGCTGETSITTEAADPCETFLLSITEDSSGSGILLANASGGTTPYTYLWGTGETTASITVTTGGTYSLEVVDAIGCILQESITISIADPCESFELSLAEQTSGSGILVTIVTGGTAPYAYSWSTGETTTDITTISDGTYGITVTDSNGCIVEESITISVANPCGDLALTLGEQPPGSGDLFAVANGGTAPYIYEWSTGETTANIMVTIGGDYSLLVTDINGCTIEESITIGGTDPCNSLTGIIAEQPPGSGSLFTSVNGGVVPYTYLWSTGETTSSITTNTFGTFSVIITDANGCEFTTEITI